MKICILGTGYVGLVTGTCLAETGNEVICVDKDEAKIEMLQRGEVPIYEPGLKELIERSVNEKRLRYTTNLEEAVQQSLINFICVGTPTGEDGSTDLCSVLAVARDIGRAMNEYKIIVDKSTVPVGTAEKVRDTIAKETKYEFDVVSNPEFLKEGAAVDDFMRPDRVVIGTDSEKATDVMKELYAPFVRTEKPILTMDVRSAEMTKYAANAMLATRISFMNEIATLCEKLGADVGAVRRGIGSDSRIGMSFLFPGIGFGGSCFPKDLRAMLEMGEKSESEMSILRSVYDVNEAQKKSIVPKVMDHFGGSIEGKKIAIWGLAFKPRTDDIREAPALTIIDCLLECGAIVSVNDPEAMENVKRVCGDKLIYEDIDYDALKDADALIVATEWNEFRHPDFERMKKLMKSPVVFDGRNIYDPERMKERGFVYYCVGRGDCLPKS